MEEKYTEKSRVKKFITYLFTFFLGGIVMLLGIVFLVLNDEKINTIEKATMITDDILNRALKKVEYKELEDAMFKGLFSALDDKYSRYFNEKEMKEYEEATDGHYVGIGILSNLEDGIKILKVFKNSPAEEAGIQKGDLIIRVEGLSIEDVSEEKLINSLLGKEGESVSITILRGDKKLSYDIIRRKIEVPFVESKKINEFGYIRIYEFGTDVSKEFNDSLENLLKEDIKGLIIDVRDNPGGILVESVDIADRLLDEGLIVYTVNRQDKKREYFSDEKKLDIPVVFLANENSASASEILLGAIKDYKKGRIIGTRTFGKGIVQSVVRLLDGTGYKMTVSQYFTPNGNVIHKKGVEPDIEIIYDGDISFETIEKGEDPQFNEAIRILKGGAYDN